MNSLFYAARPILSDMLSTILFAVLFSWTDNAVVATSVSIALGVGQVIYEKARGKSVPGMQWASLGLVTVLGGATLMTGDPRFVMAKPTVIYLTIGAAMMQRDWLDRYIPPAAKTFIPDRVIVFAGYAWAGLMFATALANLAVATMLGQKAWVAFIAVFPLASKLVMFAATYFGIRWTAIRNRRRGASRLAEAEAQPA